MDKYKVLIENRNEDGVATAGERLDVSAASPEEAIEIAKDRLSLPNDSHYEAVKI